ncbi:cysteine hydrolase family protein [Streptomyces tubercidicus]
MDSAVEPEELTRGSDGRRIVPEPTPEDAEPLVEKSYGGSFEDTTLETALPELGVGRLVVGAETDACIRSTLQYYATLVSDAHTTGDKHGVRPRRTSSSRTRTCTGPTRRRRGGRLRRSRLRPAPRRQLGPPNDPGRTHGRRPRPPSLIENVTTAAVRLRDEPQPTLGPPGSSVGLFRPLRPRLVPYQEARAEVAGSRRRRPGQDAERGACAANPRQQGRRLRQHILTT